MLGKRPEGLLDSVYVHALAFVECDTIGAGTRVWGFAHVMKGAKIGEGCNLGEHVFVEGGAVIGNRVTIKNGISVWDRVELADDVFVGPAVVFTNDMRPRAFIKRGTSHFLPTRVGQGATLGAGSVIVCGSTIGPYAFVAAGAVVTKDVPPYGFVKGNPAKLSGYACKCASTFFKLGTKDGACKECGHTNPQASGS
jgi:acetyltransferase-like isoleucine patch superfamily enzyme